MKRRLALTSEGQITYCSAPLDKRGSGRCNHIGHQNDNEDQKAFVDRISDPKIKKTTTIEIERYKMGSDEIDELPIITGRKDLADETNEGGRIELDQPLWNKMDKEEFSSISGMNMGQINEVLEGKKYIVLSSNDADSRYQVGSIVSPAMAEKLKDKGFKLETGPTGMNEYSKENFDYEATKNIYVLPYRLRQDPPEETNAKNPINALYNSICIKRRGDDLYINKQKDYERLLDNEGYKDAVKVKGYKTKGLSDLFVGKKGIIKGNLSGNNVPFSSRAVLNVDTEMDYDSAAIPPRSAVTMFEPNIRKELRASGYDDKQITAWLGKYKVEQDKIEGKDLIELANVVDRIDTRMIILRQPTLHNSNILGNKVKISTDKGVVLSDREHYESKKNKDLKIDRILNGEKKDEGDERLKMRGASTIRVNPMKFAGMASDVDGDSLTMFGINDRSMNKIIDEEIGVRSNSGRRKPGIQSESINKPVKESLFGMKQILRSRSKK